LLREIISIFNKARRLFDDRRLHPAAVLSRCGEDPAIRRIERSALAGFNRYMNLSGVDLDGGTDVLPPLSFGRGQHRGNHASVVIRPDRKYGMIVLEGWRAPR
jgi:hypothetical protein